MEEIKNSIKTAFASKMFVGFLYGIGIVVVVLIIFSAGVSVGLHKASFGQAWGEHYNENFGMGRPGGFMMVKEGMMGGNMAFFPNAHGAIGKIIKIQLPSIIVEDEKDGKEKVVLVANDTNIENASASTKSTDLKIGDYIVVIGSPNASGQVEAKLVRVMPQPEMFYMNTPTKGEQKSTSVVQ